MTFQHRAGVSPYTSPFGFAETCVFDKQLPGPFHCGLRYRRHPFFRSYGVNMPSSLTTLLPLALGFSPHLPVSVYGTGAKFHSQPFLAAGFSHFPTIISVPFDRLYHPPAWNLPSCQLLKIWRQRNLYRLCIDYAFRPRLSSRLTRGGRTYPRKP